MTLLNGKVKYLWKTIQYPAEMIFFNEYPVLVIIICLAVALQKSGVFIVFPCYSLDPYDAICFEIETANIMM